VDVEAVAAIAFHVDSTFALSGLVPSQMSPMTKQQQVSSVKRSTILWSDNFSPSQPASQPASHAKSFVRQTIIF